MTPDSGETRETSETTTHEKLEKNTTALQNLHDFATQARTPQKAINILEKTFPKK